MQNPFTAPIDTLGSDATVKVGCAEVIASETASCPRTATSSSSTVGSFLVEKRITVCCGIATRIDSIDGAVNEIELMPLRSVSPKPASLPGASCSAAVAPTIE